MKYYGHRLQVKVNFISATDTKGSRISIKCDGLHKIIKWCHATGCETTQAITYLKENYSDVNVVGIVDFKTYYVLLLDNVLTKKGE